MTFVKLIKFIFGSKYKNAYKLENDDHLWLLFIDQNQSDVVFFAIISIQIYKIT